MTTGLLLAAVRNDDVDARSNYISAKCRFSGVNVAAAALRRDWRCFWSSISGSGLEGQLRSRIVNNEEVPFGFGNKTVC